jgi:(p)ppGpp synthase/HD superfamily hydrolase
MGTLEDAIALAVEKHRGQRDKNGRPYILHPLRVLHRLDWNTPDAAKIAAVLHDVVEDTDVTLDELRERGFPEEALQAIGLLTKRDGESYPQFIERLLPNRIARMVKRADLEDNMDLRRLARVGDKERQRLDRYRAAWTRIVSADDLGSTT